MIRKLNSVHWVVLGWKVTRSLEALQVEYNIPERRKVNTVAWKWTEFKRFISGELFILRKVQ